MVLLHCRRLYKMMTMPIFLALVLQVSHLSTPTEASPNLEEPHDSAATVSASTSTIARPNPNANIAIFSTPDNGRAVADVDVDVDEYDDRTLLDTFGEATKHFLTQKVIPETNPECKWDWRYVRCEPFCDCSFAPKRGDYHLGRACRRQEKSNCDSSTTRPSANPAQLAIQRVVQGSQLAIHVAQQKTKQGYEKLQSSVCSRLPEIDCSGDAPTLAWQERALCRHLIPSCHEPVHTGTLETHDLRTQPPDTQAVEVDSPPATASIELVAIGRPAENTLEFPHEDHN